MRKALTLLMCYAVGMVAFATDADREVVPYTSIDFSEMALWGKRPCYDLHDTGTMGGAGARYWYQYGGSDNDSVVTNYATATEKADRYKGFKVNSNPQPSYMQSGADNTGYAMIRAGEPLARTFRNVDEEGNSSVVLVPPEQGLFVDTLVRFYPRSSAVTEVPTVDVRGRAKFMCWLSVVGGETNLVVTAGRYTAAGELTRANYVTTNRVEVGKWYRLTARAIANAATSAENDAPAFVLFLDGQPVVCEEAQYVIGEDAAMVQNLFGGNEFFSRRALFPPICRYTGQNPGLYGFAVAGRADIDEFAVVNTADPLEHPATELEIAVACDPLKVTNVVCTVSESGNPPYFTTNTYGVAEVLFKAKPGDVISVSGLSGEGFSLKALELSGNPSAIASQEGFVFTLVSPGPFESASRISARITTGGAQYRVGDRTFESFDDAVAAASESGEVLALESDIDLDVDADNGQMRVKSLYDVRMDLRGRTIRGSHFQAESAIYDQGRLEIFDSVGGGAILAAGEAVEVVSDNDALNVNHRIAALTLGSTAETGDFTVRGRVRVTQGELKVMGGSYLTPPAEEPRADFYLKDYLASDRFGATDSGTETIGGKLCHWWSVAFDGRYLVHFNVEHGEVSPVSTNVDVAAGTKLIEPTVTAPGYAITNWLNVAEGTSWSFENDEVTGDMTLLAQQELSRYTITYSEYVPASAPTSYTVESEKTVLPTPTQSYFMFDGWRDSATGYKVRYVGQGAVFEDTELAVTGNLELVAIWVPKTLTWQNSNEGLVESNGCYAGSWSFVVPVRAELPFGSRVAIDEIAFGVVNPLTYPKTAPCLKVTAADGSVSISQVRADFYVEETKEYAVGSNLLGNGRARLGYAFDGLVLELGKTNTVEFCDALGASQVSGFLRLAHRPAKNDPVFGNCRKEGAPQQFEDYEEYCPIYEVRGHAVKEVTP